MFLIVFSLLFFLETATKGRKRRAVRPGFFIRARGTVKHPFHDSAQPEPDPDQSEPVCVSDQACPDLESSPLKESSSEIKQASGGSDQARSVSSSVPETPDEESADPEIELTPGESLLLWLTLCLPCLIAYYSDFRL